MQVAYIQVATNTSVLATVLCNKEMPLEKSNYQVNFYFSRPIHFYFHFITIVLLTIPLFRVNKYQL